MVKFDVDDFGTVTASTKDGQHHATTVEALLLFRILELLERAEKRADEEQKYLIGF